MSGDAGYLPGADRMLAAPDVDGLLAGAQEVGHHGDFQAGGDQIEDAAADLGR